MMKTTVTSWSFPQLSLREIVGLAKVLDLGGVDIGYFYRSALDRVALLSQPEAYAESLSELDCTFPCLYHLFGEDLYDRNVADTQSLSQNVADITQAVKFCKAAGVGQIMLLPGMVMPGKTRAESIKSSIANFKEIVPVITDAGLQVSFEPHVHGLAESPATALEIVNEVPDLGLTLDYAHLVCLGFTQESIDVLVPHATHIHLRQARPGRLQEKMALGTINFNALLGLLSASDYEGYVAYEYVHQDYMGTLQDDVLSETILMRDLVKTYLAA